MRSLATQLSLGHKLDPDINQLDFAYKLDRNFFQIMIINMDWIEESKIRKYQVALRTDNTIVYVTTYTASPAEAFQRANSYQQERSLIITG